MSTPTPAPVRDYGYSQDRDIYGHPTTHVPALASVEDIRRLVYGPPWWLWTKGMGRQWRRWLWWRLRAVDWDKVTEWTLVGTGVAVVGYLGWVVSTLR